MKTYLNIKQPIIFSAEMLHAIIEGEKDVTRRVVEPQPPGYIDYFNYFHSDNKKYRSDFGAYMQGVFGEPCSYPRIKAKYALGDRLWVRETWAIIGYSNESFYEISVRYKIDNREQYDIDLDDEQLWDRLIFRQERFSKTKFCENLNKPKNCPGVNCYNCEEKERPILWRSSRFMPRAAARLWLEVTDVKLERLHELDDIEARREGFENRDDFIKFWDSKNKKRGFPWAANPWVYRIQFKEF